MIINHNIPALNTHRMLTSNHLAAQKAMEKLSSGLRINRAGDDAAGLAISEKMRAQIRGLNQAMRNAQDGISLIQTAEGALQETHAILQRMRELAVQAANDTNTEVDRAELQKEVDQLAQELTRIAETTEFNTKKLLDGTFSGTFHIGANEGQDITLSIGNMDAKTLGVQGTVFQSQALTSVAGLSIRSRTGEDLTIVFNDASTDPNDPQIQNSLSYNDSSNTITITLAQEAGDGNNPGAITATHGDILAMLQSVANEAGIIIEVDDSAFDSTASADTLAGQNVALTNWQVDEEESKNVGIYISDQKSASAAITVINNAIEQVSAERSKLGAYQNRLEHTINNLGTSAENLQAAESRIRDVDYALAA